MNAHAFAVKEEFDHNASLNICINLSMSGIFFNYILSHIFFIQTAIFFCSKEIVSNLVEQNHFSFVLYSFLPFTFLVDMLGIKRGMFSPYLSSKDIFLLIGVFVYNVYIN